MPKKIIYADDAIDAVTSSVMEWDGMYIQDLNGRIREAIEQLPSAQPQWIPVTERLPDKDGRYLVTNSHWGAYEVDWNIFFNNQGWLWEKGVIAWMPLPEPYKS